ncbi:hypothetical protein GQR58_021161 [Nymphon striatum]|nr:hypothetical protein GQR58_021161 [Nymphon striatum]
MRKNNKLLAFIVYIALINPFVNVNVQAETFSGIDVIADAHTFECLDYEIIMPICIYLLIIVTPFGVYFKWYFRDRINHNLPDLVVTSFKTPGQTPFTDIRSTESKAAMEIFNSSTIRSAFDDHALGGGEVLNGHVGRQSSNTVKNNRMFEANVIGSPAPKVIRKTMKYGVPAILGKQFISSATQMPAGDEKRKAWQMLVPEPSDQCEAFGTDDKDWPKKKNNEEGEVIGGKDVPKELQMIRDFGLLMGDGEFDPLETIKATLKGLLQSYVNAWTKKVKGMMNISQYTSSLIQLPGYTQCIANPTSCQITENYTVRSEERERYQREFLNKLEGELGNVRGPTGWLAYRRVKQII